ncbi:haloacid dehalogenase [Chloroflexota bacterium]
MSSNSRLEMIREKVCSRFSAEDSAREKALRLCREVIRHSSNAIRAVHRKEYDEAHDILGLAQVALKDVDRILDGHEGLLHSGFVHNSQKEYAEGRITLALVCGQPIPEPEELEVADAAYLNGLGEAVGEMRRHLLDSIREGDLERCEEFLKAMDDIYGLLVTIDFPDALTLGLRRTTDVTRGILEKTRGDLTLALRQRHLEQRLDALMGQQGEAAPPQ